jgi:PAS domain S-box-containing protein
MRSAEFRRIVESIKVAIAMTDGKGAITFSNVMFAELVGREERDLVGTSLADIFAEDDRKRVQQNVGRIGEGKAASAIFEGRVNGAEGERWVQIVMQPALDNRDQPGGTVALLHDIGAQRDTEQALYVLTARLLALAEASPVAAMIESAAGDVEMVNEAFLHLLGLEDAPQSFMGLPADGVLGRSKAIDGKSIGKARAKKRGNPTIELNLPEGAKMVLERQPIIVEGEASGGVWSPQKETSSESAAKGAAEVALIEKIGEELSRAMDGITAIAMRAQQMDFDQELVDHFQRIRLSTENAMAAIGDLVDFSNLSGNIVLRKADFALRTALSRLLGRLLIEAEEKNCRLRLKIEQDVSDNLVGDVERLEMIVKNLLESAVALLPGAEITLQITPEYVTAAGIQISFSIVYSDEGETKPTTMAGAESGMRIAVARFMVTAMGGKLAVAAHPVVGEALYAFTIEFPVRPPSEPIARPKYVSLVGMPALIVSGNPQQRHHLAELLRGWRMLPIEADNAPVALALLERLHLEGNPIPLVILSNRLGAQDGFLLAFRLRHHPRLSSSILMMLATEGRPGDAMACRENGIAAYMRYPVNDEQLNQAIQAVTGAAADLDSTVITTLVTRHSLREHRKGATILLVDPSRDSQLLAAHFLGREDCSVVVAQDRDEALSALDQDVYDVVLVDTSLEGLQGDGAAQLLRQRMRHPDAARLIAITDEHSAAFDKAKRAIGFTSTLAKPFRKDDLHSVVETLVKSPIEA